MENNYLKYELSKLFKQKELYIWIILYPVLGFGLTYLIYKFDFMFSMFNIQNFIHYNNVLTFLGKTFVMFPVIVNVFVVSLWLKELKNGTLGFLVTRYKSRFKVYVLRCLFLLSLIIIFDIFVFLCNNIFYLTLIKHKYRMDYISNFGTNSIIYSLLLTVIFDIFLCSFSTFLTLGINHQISGLILAIIIAALYIVVVSNEKVTAIQEALFVNRIRLEFYARDGEFYIKEFYITYAYGIGLSVLFYGLGYWIFKYKTLK